MGIEFKSAKSTKMDLFVKFPVDPEQTTPFTDANWGPQDQSVPKTDKPPQLDLFKSRSISGFLLWTNGPLHWVSKWQSIAACSSAEAEMYTTDECIKSMMSIHQILEELNMRHNIMPAPTTVYNDNAACVAWSHTLTTKGLRHIQMRENGVREE